MSLIQSIRECFNKYSTFLGTSTRSEFWWYALTYFIISSSVIAIAQYISQLSLAYQLLGLSGDTTALVMGINLSIYSSIIWGLGGIICTVLFIPFLAAGSRRLHDINMSAKWQWLQLSGIGYIWLIVWWSLKVPADFTFRQAISSCWTRYFRFSGISTKSEFWWFALYTILFLTILTYLYLVISVLLYNLAVQGSQIWSTLYTIWQVIYLAATCLLIIPLLAAGSRRLHDTNRTGWLQALLLTGIGIIVLAILWSKETNLTRSQSRYSPETFSLDWESDESPEDTLVSSPEISNDVATAVVNPEVLSPAAPKDIPTTAPNPIAAFCTNCGNRLSPGSKFCPNCGVSINQ